jgi:hypothetical protein
MISPDDGDPLGIRPYWWTPEVYRESVKGIAEMTDCSLCACPVEDHGGYKFCRKCRTAYSPVVDYEALEAELIMDALAGDP